MRHILAALCAELCLLGAASLEKRVLDAYLSRGSAASSRLRSAVTNRAVVEGRTSSSGKSYTYCRELDGRCFSVGNRTLLLAFPNTGSSMTLKLAQGLSYWADVGRVWSRAHPKRHDECTEYPLEAKKKPGYPDCGPGAFFLQKWGLNKDGGHDHPWPVLVKTHGVNYGWAEDPDCSAVARWDHRKQRLCAETGPRALVDHLNATFGACDGDNVSRVLQLFRNPYDTLAARYKFQCSFNKRKGCGTPDFVKMALVDLCVLLRWHHRAHLLRCPTTYLDYDTAYVNPREWFTTVLATMAPAKTISLEDLDRLANDATRDSITPRNLTSGVPFHVVDRPDLFDAPMVTRIADVIESYLDRSENFQAPQFPTCL